MAAVRWLVDPAGAGAPDRFLDHTWILTSWVTAALWLGAGRGLAVEERTRRALRFMAAGAASHAIGATIAIVENRAPMAIAAFPSTAAAFSMLTPLLTLAGILALPRRRTNFLASVKFTLDASMIMTSGLVAVVFFALGPALTSVHRDPWRTALTTYHPIVDLVVVYAFARVALDGADARLRAPLRSAAVGLGFWFLGDVAWSYLSALGVDHSGDWPDRIWGLATAFMATSAVQFQRLLAGASDVDPNGSAVTRNSYVPYVVLAAGYGVLLFALWQDVMDLDGTPGIGRHEVLLHVSLVVLMTVCVVGRQILALRENETLLFETSRLTDDLRRSESRFRSLVQTASEVIIVLDGEGRIIYRSPAAERQLGAAHASVAAMVDPENAPAYRRFWDALLSRPSESRQILLRVQDTKGQWRWVETIATNLLEDAAVNGVVLSFRDVTERKSLEDQLHFQALHDPLTSLPNRSLFLDRVERALHRARHEGRVIAVLFIDLDNFKTINDSLGHTAGDTLLKAIAERLRRILRRDEWGARIGGDEFALLIDGEGSEEALRAIAARVHDALAEPLSLEGRQVVPNASIGIAVSGPDTEQARDLVRNADTAMYAAKRRGRAGYAIFEPSMHAAAVERLELQADLVRAINRGEFRVQYQPVFHFDSGTIVGAEALIRWEHPERGTIMPSWFVPQAEEAGLISQIGRWVLREATAQARSWRFDGPAFARPWVSVNISAGQLQDPRFVVAVDEVLRLSKLEPSRLVLEVTESVLIHDADAALERMRALRSLGIRLAIDDFGTGYSSLGYLRRLPLDLLKIDRSFIRGFRAQGEEAALMRAILYMARVLKLQTIAEGIEDAAELREIRSLNCEYGQGYYYTRPLDASGLAAMLTQNRAAVSGGRRFSSWQVGG